VFENETRLAIDTIIVRNSPPSPRAAQLSRATVFKVDYQRNSFFTGRQDELEKLHAIVLSDRNKKTCSMCAIHGMGGIGKTQFAVEYCHSQQDEFDFVFWLPSENVPQLAKRFADIAACVSRQGATVVTQSESILDVAVKASKHVLEETGMFKDAKTPTGMLIGAKQTSDGSSSTTMWRPGTPSSPTFPWVEAGLS
jgi:hypothetical protein